MKKMMWLLSLVLACSTGWSQINEKDTTVTTVTAKNGSVIIQADVLPDYINLTWTKGPDDLIGYFELYRSADGIAYHLVRQFHPASFDGNDNSYVYRDEDPLRGRNFYRLVGYDKHTQQKKNVEIVADYKNAPRKIAPTLISKGDQLYIQNYDGAELHLWVYNSMGNPVVRNRIVNASVVNLPEDLSNGVYIYQLLDRRKLLVAGGKFVKQ